MNLLSIQQPKCSSKDEYLTSLLSVKSFKSVTRPRPHHSLLSHLIAAPCLPSLCSGHTGFSKFWKGACSGPLHKQYAVPKRSASPRTTPFSCGSPVHLSGPTSMITSWEEPSWPHQAVSSYPQAVLPNQDTTPAGGRSPGPSWCYPQGRVKGRLEQVRAGWVLWRLDANNGIGGLRENHLTRLGRKGPKESCF